MRLITRQNMVKNLPPEVPQEDELLDYLSKGNILPLVLNVGTSE